MNKKWLKKFIGKLNRSDGVSIMAIVVLMLIMTIMGGAFTSVMSRWKTSAPMAVNSARALQLANTAAAFALQEASYKFYSKDPNGISTFNFGTSAAPYTVYNNNGVEIADYWFELPGVDDDDLIGPDADGVDDDGDDVANPTLYTIIATGRINIGGVTVAKRQTKVLVNIASTDPAVLAPGIHTDGAIGGNGNSGYDFYLDGNNP